MAEKHTMFKVPNKITAADTHTRKVQDKIIEKVRPYTVVPDEGLRTTMDLVIHAIEHEIPGVLVECGVWRGGCSAAMLLIQQHMYGYIKRPVWMYDSFEGMSPPVGEDGKNASNWWEYAHSGKPDPYNQNYCVASEVETINALKNLGVYEDTIIVKGWFSETINVYQPNRIAVLRVDCDWYEPCKQVYNALMPLVSPGSPVIIDDYYVWDGAILAVHEWLVENKKPWPIHSIENLNGAWFLTRR